VADQTVNHDMILGELRGQVRELVHSVNNLNGKFDALTREVVALGPLAADISEIKQRLAKLEDTDSRQTGGIETLKVVLTSPMVLSILMLAAVAWATLTGKFKP
jgi:uncharacterized coiled-coil protein SlyX